MIFMCYIWQVTIFHCGGKDYINTLILHASQIDEVQFGFDQNGEIFRAENKAKAV